MSAVTVSVVALQVSRHVVLRVVIYVLGDDAGYMSLQHTDNHLADYMASQPRRPQIILIMLDLKFSQQRV
jgi:hypothetical protein